MWKAPESLVGSIPSPEVLTFEEYKADTERGSQTATVPQRHKKLLSEASSSPWGLDPILASSVAPFIASPIPLHEPRARVSKLQAKSCPLPVFL